MRHLKYLAASIALMVPAAAFAQAAVSPWDVHVGVHKVDPTSDSGRLAGMKTRVDSNSRPTVSLEYHIDPAWSIEALAAWPFTHHVSLAGQRAVTVKQLPPVVGVNYRFLPAATVSPFVGVGVNYTHFYDAKGQGPLDGARVDLDDSWGVAWHAGVEFHIDAHWSATIDARYIDIDTKVKVGGAHVGTASIDPWVYGASIGYRF